MNLQPRGFELCWRAIQIVMPAANFYWQILPELWAYAANRIGEVADTRGRYRSCDEGWIQLGAGAI